jgi:hypothetical protein
MDDAKYRYQTDPVFHRLVDVLYNAINTMQLSPSEIRDAAMFAAIMFEERHIRPVAIKLGGGA